MFVQVGKKNYHRVFILIQTTVIFHNYFYVPMFLVNFVACPPISRNNCKSSAWSSNETSSRWEFYLKLEKVFSMIEKYNLVDKDPEKGLSRFQVVTDFIDAWNFATRPCVSILYPSLLTYIDKNKAKCTFARKISTIVVDSCGLTTRYLLLGAYRVTFIDIVFLLNGRLRINYIGKLLMRRFLHHTFPNFSCVHPTIIARFLICNIFLQSFILFIAKLTIVFLLEKYINDDNLWFVACKISITILVRSNWRQSWCS